MKLSTLILIAAIFFISGIFSSCGVVEAKCWGFSCVDRIEFSLISKSTQNDLVLGISPLYKSDSMQLNKKPNFNLGYHTDYLSAVNSSGKVLSMSTARTAVDTSYLRLTYTDIDTLMIKYVYENENCCKMYGGYGKIITIKYNDKIAAKNGNTFIFEK